MTFDTGVLIGLERRHQRPWKIFRRLRELGAPVTLPMVVIGEWWRGRTDLRERVLEAVRIEPVTVELMQTAGEAMAAVRGATLVDAIVMASAARRNDDVLTADFADLDRLRVFFPGVRVLAI